MAGRAARVARVWQSLFTAHPARTVVMGFGSVILLGTAVLMLPVATEDGSSADLVTALFTSTSAVCVTGLVVVDTGTYWSGFGEGVILALFQVGGFGIMTMASLLGLLISGKLRLRMQLTAQAETKSLGIGDVRRVLLGVAGCTLAVELAVGAALALRLRFGYGESIWDATYLGFFHAVSAFNNAGFGLHADSLTKYALDPWVTLPVAVAVIGLGRFGSSLANELMRRGWDVLGVDTDAQLVQKYSDDLTHAAVADCTDPETLRQLGVHEFTSAVVGIGTDIEASILIASNLLEAEVSNIWAKAISRQHGKIL